MLTLRCAQGHRPSGDRGPNDYDILDGERSVGRIFLQAHGAWFWGLNFMAKRRMIYGSAKSREGAIVAFTAEYETWKKSAD